MEKKYINKIASSKEIRCKLLNLDEFKTKKCFIKLKHNPFRCFYYHSKIDKRRNFNLINYDLIKCNIRNCKNQNFCMNSHNNLEILYHPNFYKKKICKEYFFNKLCKYENFCSFAHSEKELKVKLIHNFKFNYQFFLSLFKTEFCPWGTIKHDKTICVYSHNFQDFKRNNLLLINPIKCKNWNINKCYRNYLDGCENGINCKFCHGKLEYNFHPLIYKKKRCKVEVKNCKFKTVCHFFHPEIDNYLKIEKDRNCLIPQILKIY